ncbi:MULTISPECIES: sulfotransferase [unclassified Halomonas]|uniref:sulfotransferase family protein n=1 Tax=unclassified Halomonas TaxID=2609666 RepID=UPI0007D9CE97|nr:MULTISPECIES: sulfotransferase [unclassified Halomonas]MBT2787315.1 sulfotransferase [Halomonas sp. ISL-106]MBT2796321.1 sulfotransferase [Halomonas sp. ISL-104]OAL57529.1 hypothetical protein A6R74_12200 [Halomonas sp. ALS9]
MKLFITGMMRSGTTLLQKVLDCHPDLSVSYQLYTDNFVEVVKRFHAEKNIQAYHVFNNYSDPIGYSFSELQKWLDSNIKVEDLLPADVSGDKEVLVEEFVPFLLSHGIKCINVVRDPRDMIASMSFGNGEVYTGSERPVLFDLRNWRKSVHIGYECLSDVNFKQVKFEDLIYNPQRVLKEIFVFLGLDESFFNIFYKGLNENTTWKGNSSFGDKKLFDQSVIGNFSLVLPSDVISYIEAVCWQEMDYADYSFTLESKDREGVVRNYFDSFDIKRDEFDKMYSSSKANVEYEIERLSKSFGQINKEILS